MKPYSPFQTELYLRCPLLRRLTAKERWVPRLIEQRDISAILGQAIASGLEAYNLNHVGTGADWGGAAYNKASELQAAALSVGRTLPAHFETQWDRVPVRAESAVNSYVGLADANGGVPPGLPSGSQIVAVERSFGAEGGWGRPDIEVDDGIGACVPYDYKTSLSLGGTKAEAARNLEKRIQRFADAHQFFHYAWWDKTLHYYVGNMILEPFQFETLRFVIHPETLQMWERGAAQTWHDMEKEDKGERVPAMAATHADQFGECAFKKACFEHHLDPTLMASDYVRVPAGPWRG